MKEYVILDVSPRAYNEISERLKAIGRPVFASAQRPDGKGSVEGKAVIDMSNIMLGYLHEKDSEPEEPILPEELEKSKRRSLPAVIDQILLVVPVGEVELRKQLEWYKTDASFKAPEQMDACWWNVAEYLNDTLKMKERWHWRVQGIFIGDIKMANTRDDAELVAKAQKQSEIIAGRLEGKTGMTNVSLTERGHIAMQIISDALLDIWQEEQ